MNDHAEHRPHPNYIIIWVVLVALFSVSLGFSLLSSMVVGIVFAFFIAIIKALMVAAWFMHINIEPKWVWGILLGALLVVFILWLGVATDVMEMKGVNWVKTTG